MLFPKQRLSSCYMYHNAGSCVHGFLPAALGHEEREGRALVGCQGKGWVPE